MLRPGSRGEAVRDLQQRLGAAGLTTIPPVEAGDVRRRAPSAAVRAFQDAPRAARRRHLRRRDLGRAGRERLPPRRPPALPAVARCCAATTSPSSSAARTRSASTPAARTASSGRRPTRRLLEFQRNSGPRPDGICGPDDARRARPRRRARPDGLASPACASARRCAAARAASTACGCSSPPSPAFERARPAVGPRRCARARRRASCSTPRAPTDPSLAAEANRFDADVFLALRDRRRARLPLQLLRVRPFRSEAGYAARRRRSTESLRPCSRPSRRVAGAHLPVAPRDAHGRGRLRARSATTTSTAMRAARRRGAERGRRASSRASAAASSSRRPSSRTGASTRAR